MSSVPKFRERCWDIWARLLPEAQGEMEIFHYTVLLSSSGTCLHGLCLPCLEGKNETVAVGSAL